MTGSPGRVEWAEKIKLSVGAEFDRVRLAFQGAAERQNEVERTETQAVLAILQDKRVETLAKDDASYFIRDWHELRNQVRQLIFDDPRYQALQAGKAARTAPVPAAGPPCAKEKI